MRKPSQTLSWSCPGELVSEARRLSSNSVSLRAHNRNLHIGPYSLSFKVYDRGNPKQVVEPHQFVDPKEYTGERVKLPSPEEIPNIDLQVVNFHKPPVGTFQ